MMIERPIFDDCEDGQGYLCCYFTIFFCGLTMEIIFGSKTDPLSIKEQFKFNTIAKIMIAKEPFRKKIIL